MPARISIQFTMKYENSRIYKLEAISLRSTQRTGREEDWILKLSTNNFQVQTLGLSSLVWADKKHHTTIDDIHFSRYISEKQRRAETPREDRLILWEPHLLDEYVCIVDLKLLDKLLFWGQMWTEWWIMGLVIPWLIRGCLPTAVKPIQFTNV